MTLIEEKKAMLNLMMNAYVKLNELINGRNLQAHQDSIYVYAKKPESLGGM